MKQIMLVTDNPRDYSNFIETLRTVYTVDAMGYISTARRKLSGHLKDYLLIISEVSMTLYEEFSLEEAKNGEITGIVWFEKELAQLGIPVLFWSYFDQNERIRNLKKKYPDNKIGFLQRNNFEEDHLLVGVKKFLNLKK